MSKVNSEVRHSSLVRAKFRVKIRSLAEEAKIIRQQERRVYHKEAYVKAFYQACLHSHRVTNVRQESRATLLAYAFVFGRPYSSVERKTITDVPITAVVRVINSLSYCIPPITAAAVTAWVKAKPAELPTEIVA